MIKTQYYHIDKEKLLVNMQKIAYVREQAGAKALLALKCFATWSGEAKVRAAVARDTPASRATSFRSVIVTRLRSISLARTVAGECGSSAVRR